MAHIERSCQQEHCTPPVSYSSSRLGPAGDSVDTEPEFSSGDKLLDPSSEESGPSPKIMDSQLQNGHRLPPSNRSKLEQKTYEPKAVGSIRSRAMQSAFDVILAIVCIMILAFADAALRADGNVYHTRSHSYYPYEQKLLDTARIITTAFPYFFAFVLGRMLQNALRWRMEKGLGVPGFAYLSRSTTLASAIITPFRLRLFHFAPVALLIVWALSPLGSQASLRILSIRERQPNSTSTLDYMDINSRYQLTDSEGDVRTSVMPVNVIFSTALLFSGTLGNHYQDVWGNIRVPVIEDIESFLGPRYNSAGWISVPTGSISTIWASLIGLPSSIDIATEYSQFTLETGYIYLDQVKMNVSSVAISQRNESTLTQLTDFTKQGYNYSPSNGLWQLVSLFDPADSAEQPRSSNRMIFEELREGDSEVHHRVLEGLVSVRWVELSVACNRTECTSQAIRNSTRSRNASLEDDSSTAYGLTNLTNNSYFFKTLTQAFPYYGAQTATKVPIPDPIQTYLRYPDWNPFVPMEFQYGYDWNNTAFLARRLATILNTYWIASLASNAVAGPWSSLNNTFSIENTTMSTLASEQYLYCDHAWLAVLLISTTVLLSAAIASGIFAFLGVGPDATDYLSALTLAHGLPGLPDGSYLDADDRVRRLRHMSIRIGDSNPEDGVGNIVVGPRGEVKLLEIGRFYR